MVFHSADIDEFSLPTALEGKCTKYLEDFLGAIKRSVPFNIPIFMKLTVTQRHYVMNSSKSVMKYGTRSRNSFTSSSNF